MSQNSDVNNNEKQFFIAHIITLGDAAVGKTSLITRYVDNKFRNYYLGTIGIDSQIKKIQLKNGEEIKVLITDTAGQERYRSIATNYINKANGILLIYDITNKESFDNIDNWAEQIKEKTEDLIPMILIGNKKDLEEKRCISKEKGEECAKNICGGIKFYETSCKTGENIEIAINDLAEQIYNKFSMNDLEEENYFNLDEDKTVKETKKCCK